MCTIIKLVDVMNGRHQDLYGGLCIHVHVCVIMCVIVLVLVCVCVHVRTF